jgi:hypothetical protein
MAMSSKPRPEPDAEDLPLGEVPEGIGADLYPKHLEYLSRHDAFQDGVLSLPGGDDGGDQDIALDQVSEAEDTDDDSHHTGIRLRNGAIVVASGAVIAGAIAALRYRKKHK